MRVHQDLAAHRRFDDRADLADRFGPRRVLVAISAALWKQGWRQRRQQASMESCFYSHFS